MGTPIDRADGGDFRATGRGRTGSSLAVDKDRGQAEMVLDDAKEAEHDTDWKALLARRAWSIL